MSRKNRLIVIRKMILKVNIRVKDINLGEICCGILGEIVVN